MASLSRSAASPPASPGGHKVYVAVMGATGSGKSSLISSITGNEGIVGHELESETSEVSSHEVVVDGTTLVMVDTPGFDDLRVSDHEILRAIADWLEKSCEKGQRLSGLVYLHSINKTRMSGSAVRALYLFQRICGEDNYKNVILGTTFWNMIAHCEEEGVGRETQLLQNEGFWKVMKEKGAKVMRLSRDYQKILPAIMEMTKEPRVTLEIQHELKDGRSLDQTMAGLFINNDSESLRKVHEAKTAKMKEDFNKKLEENEKKNVAKRESQRKLLLKEKEDLEAMERKKKLMDQQLELFRLNAQLKEAELKARMKEEEEFEARDRKREEERKRELRRTQERESRQRAGLSLTQRKTIDQQLDLLRAASAAGIAEVFVPDINQDGVGMTSEDQSTATVKRSGLNRWCDYCLKPYGRSEWMYCTACRFGSSDRFGLCGDCYNAGRRCFNQDHTLSAFMPYGENTLARTCRRFQFPYGLNCDVQKCKKKIEGLYFHCCQCLRDDLDICVDCAITKGYRCYDANHPLTWGVQPLNFPGQSLD